jgi:hypothetical protein
MTDINTDQHRALLLQCFWELEMVQVAADFTVHLSQDVGRFRQTELLAVPRSDHLRRHSVLEHDFFEHLVVALALKDADHNDWVVELLIAHHVVS